MNYIQQSNIPILIKEQPLSEQQDLGHNQKIDQNNCLKKLTKRKKIIIFGVIIAAALLITGGVLINHFLSKKNLEQDKTIKIPENYKKYQETIKKGQENNLVEIIYVPKSQKIYSYTLYNNQTTIQGDGQINQSNAKIIHTFGLLCTDITDKEFEMILYLMNTENYENNVLVSSISGFPDMLKKEVRKLRMLVEDTSVQKNQSLTGDKSESDQPFKDLVDNSDKERMNEYVFFLINLFILILQHLSMKKKSRYQHRKGLQNRCSSSVIIQLLNSQSSKYKLQIQSSNIYLHNDFIPLFFNVKQKDGTINMINQPINLRNDFFSIYLNVLEQISPIVSKNSYTIKSNDGKRLLSERRAPIRSRSLSNEEVDKILTAQQQDNGDMSLNQTFQKSKQPSETSNQNTSYDQQSTIQNGSLLESKVQSDFSMSDNKTFTHPEDQNGLPLMKKLELKSEGLIRFVSQEDSIDDALFNTIIEYQNNMTVIQQNYKETLDLYHSIYNTNQIKGEDAVIDKDPDDESVHEDQNIFEIGRILASQIGSDMFQPIQKPIFRKSFASIEVGADIKSECKQFKGGATKDLCRVGLYGYFNGETVKIAEKETQINVTKILKYYQYIQNFVQTKLNIIKDDVWGNLKKIKEDLDKILVNVLDLIDIKKNPALKEVYEITYNDELQIFSLINTFETFLNIGVQTLSNIIAEPCITLKEQTFSFLTFKQNIITSSANFIQNFCISKLQIIKATLNSQISIHKEDYDDIKSIIDNIQDILKVLIDDPANKVFDEIEKYVQEESNQIFSKISAIEKQIKVFIGDTVTDKRFNFLKRALGTFSFTETLQKYLFKTMKKISEIRFYSKKLSAELKKNVLKYSQDILEIINKLPQTSSERSNSIYKTVDEFENIFDYQSDLISGLFDIKEQLNQIFKTISIIQSNHIAKIIENIGSNLTGFPTELLSKIKTQGQNTITKFKGIGSSIKNNFVQWQKDIASHSKKLLEDAKSQYQSLQKLFGKVQFPSDDPDMYKVEDQFDSFFSYLNKLFVFQYYSSQSTKEKPLLSDVTEITNSVNSIVKTNTNGIVETVKNFAQIPQKFQIFLEDFKSLREKTFNYFKNIRISISGIYFDQLELWVNFGKTSEIQANNYNNQLQTTVQNDIDKDINQQALPNFKNQVSTLANQDLNTYQQSIYDNNRNISSKVKDIILEIIKNGDYENKISSNLFKLKNEFTCNVATPVGIPLKMKFYAGWDVTLFFDIKIKNATLDLSAGVQAKLVLGSEVGAYLVVAEVGGYAEGIFLNAKLYVGILIKVLDNFKGSIYLDANFQAYYLKMGLYYKTMIQIEKLWCFSKEIFGRRQLNVFSGFIKSVINFVNAVAKFVKVVKIFKECVTKIDFSMKKVDLLPPFAFEGETYSKRLYSIDF